MRMLSFSQEMVRMPGVSRVLRVMMFRVDGCVVMVKSDGVASEVERVAFWSGRRRRESTREEASLRATSARWSVVESRVMSCIGKAAMMSFRSRETKTSQSKK